jgi:hypothetical protein
MFSKILLFYQSAWELDKILLFVEQYFTLPVTMSVQLSFTLPSGPNIRCYFSFILLQPIHFILGRFLSFFPLRRCLFDLVLFHNNPPYSYICLVFSFLLHVTTLLTVDLQNLLYKSACLPMVSHVRLFDVSCLISPEGRINLNASHYNNIISIIWVNRQTLYYLVFVVLTRNVLSLPLYVSLFITACALLL